MRILLLGINYAPEPTGIGPFTTDLAEYEVAAGHEVDAVVAFPYYPEWRVHAAYRGRMAMRERRGGVSVHRRRLFIPRRQTLLGRALHDLSFTVNVLGPALRGGPYDVVHVIAPPPTLALSGWIASRLHGARLVVTVQDIAFDLAEGLGFVRGQRLVAALHGLERWLLDRADTVSVINESLRVRLVEHGVPAAKIEVVPNWIDPAWLKPVAAPRFRQTHDLAADAFVALYCGTLGGKQGLETFVAAARQVTHREVVVLIVGDGPAAADLRRAATGADNVRFLPLQPRDELPGMLASADVLFIGQRSGVVASVLPGKLLHYMAAEKPILAAVHSQSATAGLVEEAGCGVVVSADDPRAIARAIDHLVTVPLERRALGLSGRRFAERCFARDAVLPRYLELLGAPESAPSVREPLPGREPTPAVLREQRRETG